MTAVRPFLGGAPGGMGERWYLDTTMNLYDCNCAFGPYMTRVFRSASTPAELLEEMDWCGIQTALVYHTAMRFDVPAVGNERLLKEIEQ